MSDDYAVTPEEDLDIPDYDDTEEEYDYDEDLPTSVPEDDSDE